ncbi:MAG: DUF459 domain-containing protein [Chloroflexota bacterium]
MTSEPVLPPPTRRVRVVMAGDAPPRPARRPAASRNRVGPTGIRRLHRYLDLLLDVLRSSLPDASRSETLSPYDSSASATISVRRVLITLTFTFLLGIVATGPGLVHAGEGMPDGLARSVTLGVGGAASAVGNTTRLTWPWHELVTVVGHAQQASSPLLAVQSTSKGSAHSAIDRRGAAKARATTGGLGEPRQPKASGVPSGSSKALAVLPIVNRRHPLRLLVTGDSLTEFMGPDLINLASAAGPVKGFIETHYGTGLARPDFVDWSVLAKQQVAEYHPRAVVVLMGGNDNQNMTLGNKMFYAATAAWTREYQRRAEVCMRIWARRGHARVYWLSIPPARDPGWAVTDNHINLALSKAAHQVSGARFLNILGPVTDKGHYADFVNVGGVETLVRTPDGVHLSTQGSEIVAQEVLHTLERQWKFGVGRPRPVRHSHSRTP